uniref:Ninein-like protein-like n=1 Tax=Saccoglossus kowalevskii TaxID=10224 RepID=A0ABM0LWI5_SACKO|nr:PREDICTED: ninein-like protein-like [Saccoglossus kowalevskii]
MASFSFSTMDDEDHDVYVAQLKEVFDSCDTRRIGRLDRIQLIELCHKLQLDDQSDNLLDQLLGDDLDEKVDFEEFKEGFVLVLSNAVEDVIGSEIESEDDDDSSAVSSLADTNNGKAINGIEPKFVKDGKRYGRRSKPDFTDTENTTTDYSDTDTSYQSPRNTPALNHLGHRKRLSSIDSAEEGTFTLVGSLSIGRQLNASMSLLEVTSPTDEVQVKAIWDEVAVGQNGFLNVQELAIVCEHIGMDEMNKEELNNLFEKLDVDKDGQVSFEEFVHGLFIHGSASGLSISPSLRMIASPQKAKMRMSLMSSSMEDPLHVATPSILTSTTGSTLLTMLDPDNTGFVDTEAVEAHWQSRGIHNPHEVLEALGVDAEAGKINIQDLSTSLEQVLMTSGDENGVYQAALSTYQSELKHLKTQLDTIGGEKNKLRADLNEANARNAKLVQEVDDRHANLEKNMEMRVRQTEKKYQDKLNSLHAEIEREREMISSQAARQKQALEDIIDQLRAEESLLKEKLALAQKENNRLEREVRESGERLGEYEKTNQRLMRDLEDYNVLQKRLAELEAQEDRINEKQVQFYEQNLKEYQEQNRGLRDENDELLQQVQLLQQQLSDNKVRRKGGRSRDLTKPNRNGSVLSDYAKPVIIRRKEDNSSSEDESEAEEDSPASSGKMKRRQLPTAMRSGGDGGSNEDEEVQSIDNAKHAEEIQLLNKSHTQDINEMRINFERERKDIEQVYKLEITELEDSMKEQKEEFNRKKDMWISKLQEQEKFAKEEAEDREKKFRRELAHLREEHDQERMELLQKFAREKSELRDTLEAEYNSDLDIKIAEVKKNLLREKSHLEKQYTIEKLDIEEGYAREKTDSEVMYKKGLSDLELQFTEEKHHLKQQHGREKAELQQKYKDDIAELQQIFVKGEAGLKGQLRADFNELLEKHKRELDMNYEREKREMELMFERRQQDLQGEVQDEKSQLANSYHLEKASMEEKYKKELESEKAILENKVKQKIQHEMEGNFVDQIERIKAAHEEDIDDIKKENQHLEDKLNEAGITIEQLEKRIKSMEVEKQENISMMKSQSSHAVQQRSTLDKAKVEMLEEERATLKRDLKATNQKLLESRTSMSLAQSQHIREMQRLRDHKSEMTEKEVFTANSKLAVKDKRLQELEKLLAEKESELSGVLHRVKVEHDNEMRSLIEEKTNMEKKHQISRGLLDDNLIKLKEQLNTSTKRDMLLKDLYIENSNLMKALADTEERQKSAERNVYLLNDKNKALNRLLRKICPAAV